MTRRRVVAAAFTVGCLLTVWLAFTDNQQPSQLGSGDRVPVYPPGFAPYDVTPSFPPGVATTVAHVHAASVGRGVPNPVVNAAYGTVNGYPCGGDLPTCRVLACESGGNPTAQNPTSTASGLWQILDGTWAGFGGYARAVHAPVDVQNAKARLLWANGHGAFHWKACL